MQVVDRTAACLMICAVMRTFLAVGVLILAAAGCHRPAQPTTAVSQDVYLADESSFDSLWESSQEVLRRHRFELDRVDRRSGIITTFPVTSQGFIEFWRHDVDTAFDLLESSLRTVRRSATVHVSRTADDPSARVSVTVRRETFSTPERQVNSSSAVLRLFGTGLPGVAGEPYLGKEHDYWVDDGRDAAMEERLLERIIGRANLPVTATALSE